MSQKLISTAQLSLGISSHNNHYLFSDHYLNNILKMDARWREAIPVGEAFLAWVTGVYEQEKAQLPHYSESQLENHWFKPILHWLGHVFEGQAKIPGLSSGVKFPDYVFFPDEASRQQAVTAQQTQAYSQQALAVGEVKKWDVPLGKKSQGVLSFENNNPSYQIDYYVRATDLTWGVLSNGRLWRLVHKESSYKLDVYFEMDLAQAIEEQNLAAAIFFTLFFRQQAFRADEQGRVFLHDALTASARYTLELENDLRDNAYRALEHLIQGFIEPGANRLSADDLPLIYTNSLYLLYRIIFLFYGESRGLLPIENPAYQKYSLTQFARDVATMLDSGRKAAPMTDEYWSRLKRLFAIINGSQPDLNDYLGVPRYNGGLFNPELHPFLEQHFVGDRYLVAAIDVLARREVGDKKSDIRRENVDYRTLGVRQLGSIYEGLLEYQPRRATEPMVAIKKTKGEEWLTAAQKPAKAQVVDTRHVGDVYLVTDKGERKATGSYYTPDYIVKYIVEQTLRPLISQIKTTLQTSPDRPLGLSQGAVTDRFATEVLKLNVVDPAMGSGHFLVEATDFLARAIATDESVTVTEAAAIPDDDLVYWRRQVVEACIYGVDKNPMAVELAKLSLWLVTVARDKPLSFLDHHLRHGDSLVGARLADLERLPTRNPVSRRSQVSSEAQPLLLDESALTLDANRAVQGMMLIERMLSDSIDDIHHKEKALAELQSHLTRWRQIADLWTSSFFGNTMSPEEYADVVRYVQSANQPVSLSAGQPDPLSPQSSFLSPQQRQRFLNHPAMTNHDYFHWELAFPELFFDQYGRHKGEQAGFDAVIGNPPYVRQEGMSSIKPFLAQTYKVFSGTADLYVYFYQQSIDLLKAGGLTAFIVTNKWLRAGYGEPLRDYLAKEAEIRQVVDFGHAPIFTDVDVFPVIVSMSKPVKSEIQEQLNTDVCLFPRAELNSTSLVKYVEKNRYSVPMKRFGSTAWSLERAEIDDLFNKVRKVGIPLVDFLSTKPYYGIKTGFNEAFLITTEIRDSLVAQDRKSSEIIRPYLRGSDIKRWVPEWSNLWMIFTRRGIEIEAYPAIKAHLAKYRENLEPQPADWKGRTWEGRKPGNYQWFEIQDAVDYWELFNTAKIVYQEIQFHPRFALDSMGYFYNNKAFLIPSNDAYALGVLNSPLMWWFNWRYLPHMKDEALNPKGDLINKLPIALPNDDVRQSIESYVTKVLSLTRNRQDSSNMMLNWLQTEFNVEEWGQKLTEFADLPEKDFLYEVKTRSSSGKKHFSPAETKILRGTHQEYATQIRTLNREINVLEHRVSDLVNQAYGLTEEEISWLWQTAPPRMPIQPKLLLSNR